VEASGADHGNSRKRSQALVYSWPIVRGTRKEPPRNQVDRGSAKALDSFAVPVFREAHDQIHEKVLVLRKVTGEASPIWKYGEGVSKPPQQGIDTDRLKGVFRRPKSFRSLSGFSPLACKGR
jgi:hypothetical protein